VRQRTLRKKKNSRFESSETWWNTENWNF